MEVVQFRFVNLGVVNKPKSFILVIDLLGKLSQMGWKTNTIIYYTFGCKGFVGHGFYLFVFEKVFSSLVTILRLFRCCVNR
jgi:hypothetical protein